MLRACGHGDSASKIPETVSLTSNMYLSGGGGGNEVRLRSQMLCKARRHRCPQSLSQRQACNNGRGTPRVNLQSILTHFASLYDSCCFSMLMLAAPSHESPIRRKHA
jgi:hypothetical protein